jgi:hypothetical protein
MAGVSADAPADQTDRTENTLQLVKGRSWPSVIDSVVFSFLDADEIGELIAMRSKACYKRVEQFFGSTRSVTINADLLRHARFITRLSRSIATLRMQLSAGNCSPVKALPANAQTLQHVVAALVANT